MKIRHFYPSFIPFWFLVNIFSQVRLRSAANVLAGGAAMFIGFQIYTGNEKFYRQFVIPPMQLLSAERAHVLAVKCAAWGLVPKTTYQDPPSLVSWISSFMNV